jgi:hypothetical protein
VCHHKPEASLITGKHPGLSITLGNNMLKNYKPAEQIEAFNALPDNALIEAVTMSLITGIAPSTAEKDRHYGVGLPFTKQGKKVLYFKRDILAYLDSKKPQTSTAQNAKHYHYSAKSTGRPRTKNVQP